MRLKFTTERSHSLLGWKPIIVTDYGNFCAKICYEKDSGVFGMIFLDPGLATKVFAPLMEFKVLEGDIVAEGVVSSIIKSGELN